MNTKQIHWSHPSIIELIKSTNRDPRDVIVERAQNIVLEALQSGWSGPPYDIFALADLMKINVSPTSNISDALIRPLTRSGKNYTVEYNPNRSRGRIKFSIAHELAHTLFEDCSDQIHHRIDKTSLSSDEWQLEMLCNLAAAEMIMPLGSFTSLEQENISINNLLSLRKKYDVSTEALFLRVARLTNTACAIFCASARIDTSLNNPNYKLDYMQFSKSWIERSQKALSPPKNTLLQRCTAVGYTVSGQEQWSKDKDAFIEAVGLPPYPGHSKPRVAGIIKPLGDNLQRSNSIKYLKGNALTPHDFGDKKIIIQVVNDKTPRWGAGFGRAVKNFYPDVQKDFINWATSNRHLFKIGNLHTAIIDNCLSIIQLICQKGYGPTQKPRIRYEALKQCLEAVAGQAKKEEASIHMPRIGSGQAGGDWQIISELIEQCLCKQGLHVTVYDLPN